MPDCLKNDSSGVHVDYRLIKTGSKNADDRGFRWLIFGALTSLLFHAIMSKPKMKKNERLYIMYGGMQNE